MSTASTLSGLHAQIRQCRLCIDAGFPAVGPPLVRSCERTAPSAAPFVVIGQAPSLTDNRVGLTYRGPAGQRLIGWLLDAGFAQEQIGVDIILTALTKCFPGRLPGKSTDRAPSHSELANCRPWLDKELAIVSPRVIILFGKLAIDTFLRPVAPLDERIGRRFEQSGIAYIGLPHSSGASTWLNSDAHRKLLAASIELIGAERAAVGL